MESFHLIYFIVGFFMSFGRFGISTLWSLNVKVLLFHNVGDDYVLLVILSVTRKTISIGLDLVFFSRTLGDFSH